MEGVYKSTDGGRRWTLKKKGLGHPKNMRVSRVFLHKDGTLFAMVCAKRAGRGKALLREGVGLYRSRDGAESWTKVNASQLFLYPKDFTEAQVRALIDRGPFLGPQALEAGLVDALAYRDEVLARVKARAGDKAELFFANHYLRRAGRPNDSGRHAVALIYGVGAVTRGSSNYDAGFGGVTMGSDTVAAAFRGAVEDKDVKAIVFRIDSPGGSPLASDLVWRAIQDARERMPVIASFSDVAASGGYYVACGADRIVSQPSTYTGSIGVFVLRPSVDGLLEKLGIGVESMTRGARADLLISSKPLSPQARAVLRDDVRSVYRLFVERVSKGRDLSPEQVDAVGRGRVWTGSQALDVGLVDALGGLRTAVIEAKQAAGLPADADVSLVPYPPPRPLAAQIAEAFGLEARARTTLPWPDALRELLAVLDVHPKGAPLLIPPAVIQIH